MRKVVLLLLSFVIILLEILPFAAVLNFATDSGETIRETFSYFSLVPFGYANFCPFLTSLISSALLLLVLFYLMKGKGKKGIVAVSALAFVTSIMPFMYGFSYVSAVGVVISLLLFFDSQNSLKRFMWSFLYVGNN